MIDWHPAIGDATVLGWLTVAAYLTASLLSLFCYKSSGLADSSASRARGFWIVSSMLLLILGINKQLDLQSLFTSLARMLALNEGWYAHRRSVQLVFLLGLACFGLFVIVGCAWFLRRESFSIHLAQIGLSMLCIFVITRAASFHHIDVLLGRQYGIFRLNHLLELGSLSIFSISAAISRWRT